MCSETNKEHEEYKDDVEEENEVEFHREWEEES